MILEVVKIEGQFNEDLLGQALEDLVNVYMRNTGNCENVVVLLDIDSPGGYAHVLETVIQYIGFLKSHGVTINTHVKSKACSAAAILFMLGKERLVSPSAKIMVHRASAAFRGNKNQFTELGKKGFKGIVKDLDELDKRLYTQACRNCGINLKNFFKNMDAVGDWYMDSRESVEQKVATKIDILNI
jgi:ATP-dependent protease ClpP protease subunit